MNYKDFDPELARTLPPSINPPPVRKKKKGALGKVFSTVFCCSVIGLTAGLGIGGAMIYHQHYLLDVNSTMIYYTAPPLEASKVVTYSSADVALPDLYTMNVGATVGITVSTTVNYFGQPTSSAVAGSGFVISENGYVVTNHHVIEEAIDNTSNPIEVKFVNGDVYPATIVGYESDNDLAILKIEATGLQTVIMGDSDSLVVGETVVAIGNPLGELDFTFTNGIISAKDRLISTGDGYSMNMLQTNTAINPGNSGGPLFDGQGALIGINTAKYAESSSGVTVEGLGFAIPINDVKEMITDIISHGYVTGKPYLGVSIANYMPGSSTIITGSVVHNVAPGSAAERAGLQVGDNIIAIGSVSVDTPAALTAALTEYKAGDTTEFTVTRNGQTLKLSLTFDEKNAETESNNEFSVTTPSESSNDNSNDSSGNRPSSGGSNNFSTDDFNSFMEGFFGNFAP
ncbi:MAG: trypsin-like peptidase domain-containing protein [Eubacteriales bacterium]